MAQGKMKVKTQKPAPVKKNPSGKIKKKEKKSRPKKSKASSHTDSIHQALEKAIREDIEAQTRARAISSDGRPMASGSGKKK